MVLPGHGEGEMAVREKLWNNPRPLVVFVILYGFWLVFSGHYDAFHLGLGLLCAALVSFLSYDLLLPDVPSPNKLLKVWRFLRYLPWLLYQIVLANLHVVHLVLAPAKIRPQIIHFKTRLKSDLSKVTFGNSITLTPGTITLDIDDGEIYVHALSDKVARDLLTGEMERRVAHVFCELEPVGKLAGPSG
jgi:multicomponent Na+:H+ antiporter subunit E